MIDLEEIKAALAAATPGPWLESSWAQDNSPGVIREKEYRPPLVVIAEASNRVEADAHLIARAPKWLASLIEEVERLKDERDEARVELRKTLDGLADHLAEHARVCDELRAREDDVARLESEIERLRSTKGEKA